MPQTFSSAQPYKQLGNPRLMILAGALLLVIAIGRGFARLPTNQLEEAAAPSAPDIEPDRGFLPIMGPSQPPALAPEKAFGLRDRVDQFVDLETSSLLADDARVHLPDGRSVAIKQIPTRIIIPRIELNTPVVTASLATTRFDGGIAYQWLAPDFYAAGWHYSSAPLGEGGNTVINGHHNAFGEVFRDLVLLDVGDHIIVGTGGGEFRYEVSEILILREKFESPDVRRQNAIWISPTQDERLTLVTCWPYESNANRLLVVAHRLTNQAGGGLQEAD